MRTLVLDQGYQPHHVISWQRALVMYFDGKVEVVEAYEEEIRTVSLCFKMPAVVRLLRTVRGRKRPIRFSRINVAMRDDFRCQYCNVTLPLRRLTYDHVIPRCRGGKTTWTNVVMACYECNGHKGSRTPAEAGMELRKEPIKPSWLPMVAFRVEPSNRVPAAWINWLRWHGYMPAIASC